MKKEQNAEPQKVNKTKKKIDKKIKARIIFSKQLRYIRKSNSSIIIF